MANEEGFKLWDIVMVDCNDPGPVHGLGQIIQIIRQRHYDDDSLLYLVELFVRNRNVWEGRKANGTWITERHFKRYTDPMGRKAFGIVQPVQNRIKDQNQKARLGYDEPSARRRRSEEGSQDEED